MKPIKRFAAAAAALAMLGTLPVSADTADYFTKLQSGETPYVWLGDAPTDSIAKRISADYDAGDALVTSHVALCYLPAYQLEDGKWVKPEVYAVWSEDNRIDFTVSPDLAPEDACPKINAILAANGFTQFEESNWTASAYAFSDPALPAASAAIYDALTAEGLISAFYDCGEVYSIRQLYWDTQNGESYSPLLIYHVDTAQNAPLSEILAYLDNEGYAYEYYASDESDNFLLELRMIPADTADADTGARLNAAVETEYACAAALAEKFGMAALPFFQDGMAGTVYGTNRMALPGDLNGDLQITIADAVLLSRVIAEDPALTAVKPEMANADVNGDGYLDALDIAALLKSVSAK